MKKSIWIVIALIIVVVIVVLASSNKGETGPIKIGVMLPLTGDAAAYGEGGRNTYQLATEEINAAGGIKGRNLELVIEDSKCTAAAAAGAAQKLYNVDHVQVVLGGFCSSESIAAVPIAAAAKATLFSPGSSNPGLTGMSPFFFRDYPSDASQGKVLADASFKDKGYKTVAFIQEKTDYADGIFKAFSDEFASLGGTVTNESFPTANTDFRAILSKVKNSKPDAVFIDTQTPAVSDRIIQQAQQLKYKPAIIINDATAGDVDTIAKNKDFLEGAITAQYGTDPTNLKFQHLLSAYKAKYNAELPYQSYGQTEYDAVYIVKEALLANGNDGQKIAAWSRTIKDWEGASGKVTILSSGDRDGGHVPQTVKEGKVVMYTK